MKKRLFRVIFITLFLLVILFGYYFLNCHYDVGIPCFVNKMYGLVCPGCGITRMLFSIIRLDFKAAFGYNPLMFCLLPFMVISYIYYMYLYVVQKKDNIFRKVPIVVWILLFIIVIIYSICRNLPQFPFLRP